MEEFQEQYPDDDIVQSVERVEIPIMQGRRTPEQIGDIKLNVLRLADRLDINTDDFGSDTGGGPRNVVRVEQHQSVENESTMETIMQLVDVDPQVQDNRDEIRDFVERFEDELEKDNPDEGVLRQLIEDVKQHSTSVAAKKAVRALQAGTVGILAL